MADAGYARALQERGHDRYSASFVLTSAAVALALGFVAIRQLRRLMGQTALARTRRQSVADRGAGVFARHTARLWLLVAAGTSGAFFVQEILETVTAGHPLPGLDVISGDQAVAFPAIAVVSLLVALVGALVRWGRHVMLARLHRSLAPVRRRVLGTFRPGFVARPTCSVAVHGHGLRAPPPLVPSPG